MKRVTEELRRATGVAKLGHITVITLRAGQDGTP
jgi:hypothetical protein